VVRCLVRRTLICGTLVRGFLGVCVAIGFPSGCHFVTSSAAGAVGSDMAGERPIQRLLMRRDLYARLARTTVRLRPHCGADNTESIDFGPRLEYLRESSLRQSSPYFLRSVSRTPCSFPDGTLAYRSRSDFLDCGATGDRTRGQVDSAQ
jgi:hypothetical protein